MINRNGEYISKVQDLAKDIMTTGIKYKDACHVASAILAQCDYFISTDKRLLKYKTDKIKLINNESFDYTKWQREHYDAMTPEEIDIALEKYSAAHPFHGKKAQII